MSEWSAYSRKQWVRAVNYSALLGYLALIGVPSILNANLGFVLVGATFGIPGAFLCCWAVGSPILKRLMQNEISLYSAAAWGTAIASILATISIVIGRYAGWRQSNNPNFYSVQGGGEYVTSIDGILTPYGWQMLAQDTVVFILTGAIIAVSVQWLIGKPSGINVP
jgi:hypothetical protein